MPIVTSHFRTSHNAYCDIIDDVMTSDDDMTSDDIMTSDDVMTSRNNVTFQDKPYPMHLRLLGHAVIVNNVATEMPGSMHDVRALQRAYETVGFQVHVHTDCTGHVSTRTSHRLGQCCTYQQPLLICYQDRKHETVGFGVHVHTDCTGHVSINHTGRSPPHPISEISPRDKGVLGARSH